MHMGEQIWFTKCFMGIFLIFLSLKKKKTEKKKNFSIAYLYACNLNCYNYIRKMQKKYVCLALTVLLRRWKGSYNK